ncbi:hypothetical protein BME83_17350 [Enterobacter cloacae subsp. cloacae]|nr:hypothetical protein BME83_17350 [Enterobacter cloacae subsp. cloacae]
MPWTDHFLDRLGLNPDRDYRFLGDAAFDTRYVSNAILNQTGSRYTRHTSSCLCVGCTRSPRSLTYVSSRGFTPLPPSCNSNYLGYISTASAPISIRCAT